MTITQGGRGVIRLPDALDSLRPTRRLNRAWRELSPRIGSVEQIHTKDLVSTADRNFVALVRRGDGLRRCLIRKMHYAT